MPYSSCGPFVDLILIPLCCLQCLKVRPDIKDLYLDVGCRYKKRFLELVERLRSTGSLVTSVQPRILLPLMHACDHNMQCQLENSALYQVGQLAGAVLGWWQPGGMEGMTFQRFMSAKEMQRDGLPCYNY